MRSSRGLRPADAEGVIVGLRLLTVAFACVQTATYYRPFPDGMEAVAWTINAIFAACSVLLAAWWLRTRHRRDDPSVARDRLGLTSLVVDGAFVTAQTWAFAFDPDTAVFILMYVVAVEGAFRYAMRGALATMVVLGIAYAVRDVWAVEAWDVELFPTSISFRVGVGLLIAGIAGAMAERAQREHARLQLALKAERRAANALRSLDDLRSTFLAAVSHELRTPLTSILGFTITLQDRATGLDGAERQMLDHVVEEARRIERLLEDLLDIERMGRGGVPLDRRSVDVAGIARRCTDELAKRTGRTVVAEADEVVGVVDQSKVERIVDNLVGNAIKYSPEPGGVEVSVERAGDGVMIVVDDDGPGVPESMRATIFAPFERGSLTSAHKPGTGIGLSLVDRFARLHGGRAWVESRGGQRSGASFRVYLPDGPVGERIVTVADEPWGLPGDE